MALKRQPATAQEPNELYAPVTRTTLSEQVARRIASELQSGRWKAGEKLPSEAALCKVFAVGRSTLREALKSLSFIGLIRMVAGGGSYVEEQGARYFEGSLLLSRNVLSTKDEVLCFCEARTLLETELAALCAERATAKDLQQIEATVKQMSKPEQSATDKFSELDLSFHLAIAHGARNPVLADMLKHIRAALEEFITNSVKLPAKREIVHQNHKSIYEALKSRDAALARKAMRAHLKPFHSDYLLLFED